MNKLAQEKLIPENDTNFTDAELNMLAEGEPAVDLDEIAESQYELSDDYIKEDELDRPGIHVIEEHIKLEKPETYTNKRFADIMRLNNKERENGDYL